MDHFPSQLSGGEQQRVAVARAVVKRPEILLCDEPTGALDYRSGVVVLEVIERVNQELGTATAIITHNAPIAALAHRVITLADGKITEETSNTARRRAVELRW
jgi:putative ABC transport system ATP-binding protein